MTSTVQQVQNIILSLRCRVVSASGAAAAAAESSGRLLEVLQVDMSGLSWKRLSEHLRQCVNDIP